MESMCGNMRDELTIMTSYNSELEHVWLHVSQV